jgi:hypothetical protein
MGLKHVAAFAASMAACAPGLAFDLHHPGASTMFYISIPLESGLTARERAPSFGLRLQDKRERHAVDIDSRRLGFLALGDMEPKWIIAGLVTVVATVAIGSKDKSRSAELDAEQEQREQIREQQPCPKVCK